MADSRLAISTEARRLLYFVFSSRQHNMLSALYAIAVPSVRQSDGCIIEQESPAIADKPARRESMPKIAPIRRAYNVVADNTGISSCV